MSFVLLVNNKEEYILIPNEAIRVRVIANSFDNYDVRVKEEVKNLLNKHVNNLIKDANNINEVRDSINSNLENIHNFVDKTLNELKYDNSYTINYGLNYFPEKIFKGVRYNSGLYESLVLVLGDGLGPNYWCVLYPPLCAIDNTEDIEYRIFLKDIVDKYF